MEITKGLPYRPDIDGLRALAVTSVVLFHAKLGVVSGGYVGVDIFFVISGYLIASIIAADVALGKFSIAQFYERRARRILPGLFVVLIASTLAALALLALPQDLEMFAQSARATLLFCSNFFFSRTGEYFGPVADEQPLLHTWSLGVEEQFYLVAPLLLAPLVRASSSRGWILFAGAFAFFLFLSERSVIRGAVGAFYWPHTRAFELMIGVALACPQARAHASSFVRNAAAGAGLIMIFLAALIYTPTTPFPGVAALLPCGGAALLIWAGQLGRPVVNQILSVSPLVFIGKISYSLYLWHWPIFVFAGFLPSPLSSTVDRMGLIGLALVCAVASYYFVEKPFRRRRTDSRQRRLVFGATAFCLLALMVPVQALIWSGGWAERSGPELAAFVRENPTRLLTEGLCRNGTANLSEMQSDCLIGSVGSLAPSFILWGDSHARMLAPALSAWATAKGLQGFYIAQGGCAPFLAEVDNGWRGRTECLEGAERVLKLIKNPAITQVIIAARWAGYAEGPLTGKDAWRMESVVSTDQLLKKRQMFAKSLLTTVSRIASERRSVTLIGPVPEPGIDVPRVMTRALIDGRAADLAITRTTFEKRNANVLEMLAEADHLTGVRVIYPHQTLCNADKCSASEGGHALYVDDNHLSPRGVLKIDNLLATAFDIGGPMVSSRQK